MRVDVIALFKKGHQHFKTNRLQEARAVFEEDLELVPASACFLTGLGDVHRKLAHPDKARLLNMLDWGGGPAHGNLVGDSS